LLNEKWHKLGGIDDFKVPLLREITINNTPIALSYQNGEFGAISTTHPKTDQLVNF